MIDEGEFDALTEEERRYVAAVVAHDEKFKVSPVFTGVNWTWTLEERTKAVEDAVKKGTPYVEPETTEDAAY